MPRSSRGAGGRLTEKSSDIFKTADPCHGDVGLRVLASPGLSGEAGDPRNSDRGGGNVWEPESCTRGAGNIPMSMANASVSFHRYQEWSPAPELAPWVSCIWTQQVAAGGRVYEHRTVPNGCTEISCAVGSGVVWVAGPQRGPIAEHLSPGTSAVGIRVRPGAAASILGVPASALLDLRLELDRLWGSAASRLAERIAQAASLRRAANLLEQELAVRAARASAPDALVAAAIDGLQPWRAGGVGEVASDLFISPRQMRRRFAEVLGYGPKTLQRTLRFQGFLALIHEDHAQDGALAYFAAAAGYADQAHLTRECVRLSARTPNALLREMRQACGIDHDHGASLAPLRHALLGARVS